MDEVTLARWFDARAAFDHAVTRWLVLAAAGAIAAGFAAAHLLRLLGRIGPDLHRELVRRTLSWAVLAPLMIGPVLLGAAPTILAIAALSVACYAEFARATGLFRERLASAASVAGIAAIFFAVADHWYGFFAALPALGAVTIAAVSILPDRPKGYIQRVGLAVFAFLFFGVCLGHLAYMANDRDYRPLLLATLFCVELNDVFAFAGGKCFGRRKLSPQTSPGKTVGGAVTALAATTLLGAWLGSHLFRGGPLDHPARLLGFGLILSLAGQLGDLMLSSVKRDVGIKDLGAAIPGHGGLLDRFDSLVLVAPAIFHYVGYFRGFGIDQPTRVITGG